MTALVAPAIPTVSWEFHATCPVCGGEMQFVNGAGTPTHQLAVVECSLCQREWVIELSIVPKDNPALRALKAVTQERST